MTTEEGERLAQIMVTAVRAYVTRECKAQDERHRAESATIVELKVQVQQLQQDQARTKDLEQRLTAALVALQAAETVRR
jgi:hypothetical protein